jgi:iron transport multicopper oxidase
VYNENNTNPEPQLLDSFYEWNDALMYALEPEPVIDPDESHTLDVLFDTLGDGANYAMFNEISYKQPIVPSLLTALSVPANYSTEATVYGKSTNPYVLGHNNMVQIILNNGDPGKHTCKSTCRMQLTYIVHLHGHVFQVVYRSEEEAGFYNDSMELTFPKNPMRRDTVQVRPNGFVILRFRADNPGIWLVSSIRR